MKIKNLKIYNKIYDFIHDNPFLCVFTKEYQENIKETELISNKIFKLQSDNYDVDSRIKVLKKIRGEKNESNV